MLMIIHQTHHKLFIKLTTNRHENNHENSHHDMKQINPSRPPARSTCDGRPHPRPVWPWRQWM